MPPVPSSTQSQQLTTLIPNTTGSLAARTNVMEGQTTTTATTTSGLDGLRRSPVPSAQADKANQMLNDLKGRIQQRLSAELDPKIDMSNGAVVRRTIQELFDSILEEEQANITLTRVQRMQLFEQIAAEIIGYGPIETLMADDTVGEIMVNGPASIYIQKRGLGLLKTDVTFQSENHLRAIIDRIVSQAGRRVDETEPIQDARMPDGSRVNIVIPPISLIGSCVTIRRFPKKRMTMEDYIGFGTITQEAAEFLRACVVSRLNLIVSGGTGSGKTTLLNILSNYIPENERIITVEDAAELQLFRDHWVQLQTRKSNVEGKGEVTIRDLVVACLRMRPERIIVGECRRGEALDMLQAMNTGHEGSMTTLHANSPREALTRLETMVLMAGMDLPVKAIREQIASAVDLIIQQARLEDDSKKIIAIEEIQGMEGDTIVTQPIFEYERLGVENGKVIGRLRPTGLRPKFMDKIEKHGQVLSSSVFGGGYNSRGF